MIYMCLGQAHFFLFGLSFKEAQLRHLILPWLTFKLEARILDLQFLQTKTPLINRFNASSNLVAIECHFNF